MCINKTNKQIILMDICAYILKNITTMTGFEPVWENIPLGFKANSLTSRTHCRVMALINTYKVMKIYGLKLLCI